MGVLFGIILHDNRFLHCTNYWYSHTDTSLKMPHWSTLNHFWFFASLVAPNEAWWQDWHGSDNARKTQRSQTHESGVTKGKKINGSPMISIGNGWKEFKTINDLKIGDHLSLL